MIRETPRIRLRCWQEADREAFIDLHADPEVMHDFGGPFSRSESAAKFDRYVAAFGRDGFTRWAIETRAGEFLGYAGVLSSEQSHPLGPHADIGWRLVRSAWGQGYATEAARAALDDAFVRCALPEILAYTAPDNVKSQLVMARLGLQRDPNRDFREPFGAGMWHGLVWVARPAQR